MASQPQARMTSENPRPLLLPQNRKLRHLRGIYVRNLTLTRPRGHTIDDASLNKSPGKLEALRQPQMHHAHSSDALSTMVRPGSSRRRRSTNWEGQSPGYRQKRLEDLIDNGSADSFFSLHCEETEDPLYVSEVVKKATNPTFCFFDLTNYGPSIRRLSTLTIKLWVKRNDFSLLFEHQIDLRLLQFLGTLESQPLPPNCLIFHLIDGIYAVDVTSKLPEPKLSQPLPTSSYRTLMRLSSLDDSIQDALATREFLATQINAILQKRPEDESPQAEEEAALAARYLVAERKLLKQTLKKRNELRTSLSTRKKAIEDGKAAQARVQEDVNNATEKLKQCQGLVLKTAEEIHGQRRRICEELLHIFPIEPTSQPLLFTINGLLLPNSSFDDSDEDVVGAALGYAAGLVDLLQYYLAVPLPYPIVPYGSRSIIQDQISTLADSQRTFPLYIKGTIRFRFDYGVFLLNKNIECLAESQGLKVIDIRHTLPNLKYLLYVCSAGSSELPARKAGGIRGLLAGRVTLQSGGGEDVAQGDATKKALSTGGNDNSNSNAALKNDLSPIFPFAPDGITSLRTRGLRENAVR